MATKKTAEEDLYHRLPKTLPEPDDLMGAVAVFEWPRGQRQTALVQLRDQSWVLVVEYATPGGSIRRALTPALSQQLMLDIKDAILSADGGNSFADRIVTWPYATRAMAMLQQLGGSAGTDFQTLPVDGTGPNKPALSQQQPRVLTSGSASP